MQAYSEDLRGRALRAAAEGISARQAAIRFGIGLTTATTWVGWFRASGDAAARHQGKKRCSQLDTHANFTRELLPPPCGAP